jgi:hypothetical protein
MRPKDLTFLDAVIDIDWARLAAYIDGEGCITIARMKGRSRISRPVLFLSVTIANTDPRLIQWLTSRFGGTAYTSLRSHNPKHSNVFTWNVASRHGAEIIRRALPFFVIKREQADIALAFQDTIISDRRYGRSGRPPELIAHQDGLRDQLSALKGTAARQRVPSFSPIH